MTELSDLENDVLLAGVKRPHKRLLIKYLLPFFFTLILTIAGIVVAYMFRDQFNLRQHWAGAIYAIFIPLGILASSIGLIIRFYTLRYKIDEHGIHQSSGLILRSENTLTFARIQDIQLNRDIIDRYIGLGNVSIQTASGQSTPEVTLYGLENSVEIREALYDRLRKVQNKHKKPKSKPAAADVATGGDVPIAPGTIVPLTGGNAVSADDVTELLRQIALETAALSQAVGRMDPTRGNRG